jgi:hypothetical protein
MGFIYELDLRTSKIIKEPYKRPVVLGVGLPRTGTCSLSSALRTLGWRSHHCPLNLESKLRDYKLKRDAFCDLSMLRFRPIQLLKMFPGSLMVYTYRMDERAWLRSMTKLRKTLRSYYPVTKDVLEGFESVFGTGPQEFLGAKRRYEEELSSLPPQMVLRLDLTSMSDGQKWKDISFFLGVNRPSIDTPFPYESHIPHHFKQIWYGVMGLH